MKLALRPALLLASLLLVASPARAEGMNMEQAVSVALQRNRDVIAAKLDIETAQLDRVSAGIYPNPTFSYTLGNLVVGNGNPQGAKVSPGPFSQTVHTFGVSDVIDIWNKRGARIQAADRGVELKRLQVEDALREIVHSVRSACADVLREQTEDQLARDVAGHYEETVRLSRARQKAGEISQAELVKIELEGMRYATAVIDAGTELYVAREKLAALMGLPAASSDSLKMDEPPPPRSKLSVRVLTQRAMEQRPDVRSNKQARLFADAALAAARREGIPDISLGLAFTHSGFTVSGDNPNSMAVTISLPLPIFDRNQAGIGKASVDLRRADNDSIKLVLTVEHEVAEAVRREERSRTLVDAYESGMLDKADSALRVAEKSYKAGAVSLLDLLEAQRTYLTTRAEYLKARNALVQARVDIIHAVGGAIP